MKKELWAACVNLSGFNDKPIKVTFNKNLGEYYDWSGDFGFYENDILKHSSNVLRVVFASEDKKQVEAFIAGARAAHHIIKSIMGD